MQLLGARAWYCLLSVCLLGYAPAAYAQKPSMRYLQRAETMYAAVWKQYQVVGQPGLLAENYPANRADSLTYMQGGGVSEKAVSFLWPFSGMLSATNVLLKIPAARPQYLPHLRTLMAGLGQYRDSARTPTGYQAYPVKFEKADRYYDDNGLVGIDLMEAYFNTKNPVYLRRAEGVFAFILSGWNDDLGGGVTWLEGHRDQKPACTNGMATLVALKIYQGNKNKYYLDWGKKFYAWMYQNLRDSTGMYSNDKKLDGSVNRTFWTYNSGSVLEAAVLLYRLTGEKHYLVEAQQLARAAYRHFSQVPHDKALNLKIDVPWFVTVLFRGYEALYHLDHDFQYLAAIEKDLDYAWQHSRDQYGLVTHSWTPNPAELKKPKWLLDEGCVAELYARLSLLEAQRHN
jgi:hypothetical protein